MINDLLTIALFSIGFNLAMFIPAYFFKTDKLTDLSYSLTFLFIVVHLLFDQEFNLEKLVVSGMIVLWSLRLGTYLFIRINKMRKDDRFDKMRENFLSFLGFWSLQGLTVFIVLIPGVFFLKNDFVSFNSLSYIGIGIWFFGFLVESIADFQKFNFKLNPINKDKWQTKGLWKYSRYPNYLGEILVWIGIFLTCMHGLNQNQLFVSLISPIFIIVLLLFVSGIPLIEKSRSFKFADNNEYNKYKNSTGKLVPKGTLQLIIAILIAQIIGGMGAFFTMQSVNDWYLTLLKPSWNPPSWVFGPVWSLLYTMMGVASFLIWKKRADYKVFKPLVIYGIHLAFNLLWSVLFFGLQSVGFAFIEIMLLWLLIIITIKEFFKVDKYAAYLLIPYLLWVTFAALLNLTIWTLN